LTVRPASHRSRSRPALLAAVACLLTLLVTACGGSRKDPGTVVGTRLTIYSSMPLEGPDHSAAVDVVRAQRLALRDAGSEAGRYRIDLVSLDASTPKAAGWDPAQISENARRAAKDSAAIAYVGEFHFGSSGISIPILNEVGMLEVSPMDTAMGLTTSNVAIPDSPRKYYPKLPDVGRTFARVVPSDRAQVGAQLEYMHDEGVRRLVVLTDEDPLGIGFATLVRAQARAHGIAVVGDERVDPHEQEPRELVGRVLGLEPDAVFYAGGIEDGIERLWKGLAAAGPGLKLFAPGALVDPRFLGGIGAAARRATYVTKPVLPVAAYPAAASRMAQLFERTYGYRPAPEALYGYEAMRAVLSAIQRAADTVDDRPLTRADVVREFFGTDRRTSVLGPYAIDHDGDTSMRRFGAYRVVAGQLRYVGPLAG
jgi:branched-chain amino acid transport system substrate-binding protein